MSEWDRREFIVASGAALGACAVASPAAVAAASSLAPAPIVLCDMRFEASRRFAVEAEKSGARVVRTMGDVTDFWRDELDLLWRHERVSLSGLTAYPAFFYLGRLAMDRGMRVTFKAEAGRDRLIHWAIAAKSSRNRGAIA